jgi:PAS domain-containing protein
LWQSVNLSIRWRELLRLFQGLKPEFIAASPDLMAFVQVGKETKSQFELGVFDDCGIALLVLSSDLQVLSFTRAVQTLFGYRAEQILGQNLRVLVPRDSADHNALGFYQ